MSIHGCMLTDTIHLFSSIEDCANQNKLEKAKWMLQENGKKVRASIAELNYLCETRAHIPKCFSKVSLSAY